MNRILSSSQLTDQSVHVRQPRKRMMSAVLWSLQGLLALLFLFAGSIKLLMPIQILTATFLLPGIFMKFIGIAEVAGALGLLLPGLLRIRPMLTPLAACGLILIMIGATVVTVIDINVVSAIAPLVVGLLCATIAYGRRAWTRASQF